jgi:hypothetical protein
MSPNQNTELYIGDPNAKPTPKYVELKHGLADEHAMQCALHKLKGHGGICEITFLRDDTAPPDPDYCNHIDPNIKCDTRRVIKSAAAKSARRDNSAANDPHLMYRVASPTSSDVAAVAGLLK